jgi:hypothetical protein
MSKSKNAIRRWLKVATPDQKKELAKAAKTSLGQLKHLSAGRRTASAGLAQKLAAASRTLGHRALYLDQRDICEACGVCPLVEQRPQPKVKRKSKAKAA